MTPRIAALADDLTGAAEIAALGTRCGRRAVVLTTPDNAADTDADLVVIDTDTRLDAAAIAAQRAQAATILPVVAAAALLFKKTDSVLRGPVRAELEAIAAARGLRRILLIPANPALGRIVAGGRYLVQGRPVSETAFARDPHHPVRSADVLTMLGPEGSGTVVSAAPGQPLPDAGIVIGDAASADDLATWARHVDATILPGGAAGFFAALLAQQGWLPTSAAPPPPRSGPVLVICGTKQPAPPPGDGTLPPIVFTPTRELVATSNMSARDAWFSAITDALDRQHRAFVSAATLTAPAPDTSEKIRRLFAELVAALHARGAIAHLVVEGGATASTIVRHLGWARLAATHEWTQGVVTLQPVGVDGIDLTIKPGSYAWPGEFWKLRLAADRLPPDDGAA